MTRKGQPPNNGYSFGPLSYSISTFLTSKKRIISLQRTKWPIPKSALLGNATVYKCSPVRGHVLFQRVPIEGFHCILHNYSINYLLCCLLEPQIVGQQTQVSVQLSNYKEILKSSPLHVELYHEVPEKFLKGRAGLRHKHGHLQYVTKN